MWPSMNIVCCRVEFCVLVEGYMERVCFYSLCPGYIQARFHFVVCRLSSVVCRLSSVVLFVAMILICQNIIDVWFPIILLGISTCSSKVVTCACMPLACHVCGTEDPTEKELVCFLDGRFSGYLRMVSTSSELRSVFVTSDKEDLLKSSVCPDMLKKATSLVQGRATVAVDPANTGLFTCCLRAFFKMTTLKRGDGKKTMVSTDRTVSSTT